MSFPNQITYPIPSATLNVLTMYNRTHDLRVADFGFRPRDFVICVMGVGWCDVTKFDKHGVICIPRRRSEPSSAREALRIDMREAKKWRAAHLIHNCLSLKGNSKLQDLYKVRLPGNTSLAWVGHRFFNELNDEVGHDRYWFYMPGLLPTGGNHGFPRFIVMKDEADAVTAVNYIRDFQDTFDTI